MIPYPLSIAHPIVLGSQSPRRKELLTGLGVKFEVMVIPTDESYDSALPAQDIAVAIAERKADCFDDHIERTNSLVITADTIVSIRQQILNKPKDRAEAIGMIELLSGKKHTVYTGV